MAKINFLYRGKKETGKLSIRLIHSKEIDIRISTPITSKKEYWFKRTTKNNKTKTVHKKLSELANSTSDQKNHKKLLETIQTDILTAFSEDYNNGVTITPDWLKNQIDEHTEILNTKEKIKEVADKQKAAQEKETQRKAFIENENLLLTAIEKMFIKYATNSRELKKYKVTHSLITKYQEHKKKKITTQDVGQAFADLFKNWALLDMKYSKSYINAQLKKMRASVLYAYQNDEHDIIKISKTLTSFSFFKLEKKDKIVITLNYDELDKIDRKTINDPQLLDAKKAILIGCETGLRYSDMNKLIDANIKNVDGVNYWKFRTEKTDAIVQITITDRITYLIDKYGLPKTDYPNNGVKLNKDIKNVCELAEIDEKIKGSKAKVIVVKGKKEIRNTTEHHSKHKLITTRTFRRSFATNYYGKIDTSLIRAITGHSTEAQLRAYINVNDETNILRSKEQIDKFHQEREKQKKETQFTVIKNASNQ
ncbi:Phage integrase family protein [Algibacter lectus]|uniref:tyrosine-type recombinase/integrase n=1 Tax=Algibacter lectus TaxID=221126 RepID=UPI0008E84FE6|nr:tyrosine-type recombinase/integrase [Algibacter lectus]SFD72823.1 Phage integrase family protein [Algibacter lectus]